MGEHQDQTSDQHGRRGRAPLLGADHCKGKFDSAGRDQAVGLVRREVAGRGGLDVALEVANCCAGLWPEDAVHGPFVITQAT